MKIFLSNIESFDSIISNVHFNNNIFSLTYLVFSSIFFLLPFTKKKELDSYLFVFKNIQQNYKIYTDEIMIKPNLVNNNKILEGFNIVKLSNENVQSKKEIKEIQKLIEESPNSITINEGFYINNVYYKNLPLYSNIFSKISFYDVVVNYFDNYLKETYCIDYVCKQMEIYDNIFNQLEKMSKKNDWNKFHPQIFK